MDRHPQRVSTIIARRKDVVKLQQRASQTMLALPCHYLEIALDDLLVLEQSKPVALDYLPYGPRVCSLERRRGRIKTVSQERAELDIPASQDQTTFVCWRTRRGLDKKIVDLAIVEQQVMERGMFTKLQLLLNNGHLEKQGSSKWHVRVLLRLERDAQVHITITITLASCQATAQPHGDNGGVLPKSLNDADQEVLLRQVGNDREASRINRAAHALLSVIVDRRLQKRQFLRVIVRLENGSTAQDPPTLRYAFVTSSQSTRGISRRPSGSDHP